jgi:hypothetical protein
LDYDAATRLLDGHDADNDGNGPDDAEFLEQWRETRRKELEREAVTRSGALNNRKMSPSMRIYGRLDVVDALGYLDAVEKVRQDTTVVVFVTDPEVSESGLMLGESFLFSLSLSFSFLTRLMLTNRPKQCSVSAAVEAALLPLVRQHATVHFVKVDCGDIEFDSAAVPAFLAYRNQGDLFANLTGMLDLIPDDEEFGTDSLRVLFEKHNVL